MQLIAYGAQDIYLTGDTHFTDYDELPIYYRNEEIPLNYSENYPYSFRLNLT